MAVRFDGSTDSLVRTANLPSELLFSICGFARRQGNGGTTFESMFVLRDAGYLAWAGYELNRSTSQLIITGTTSNANVVAMPANGTWYWWGATSAGSGAGQLVGYYRALDSTTLSTASAQTSSFTQSTLEIGTGNVGGTTEWFNGDIYGVKLWDATLTAAEMLSESLQVFPRRLQNLHAFWWLHSADTAGYRDLGPLVRPLTAGGTPISAENPPVRLSPAKQRIWPVPAVAAAFDAAFMAAVVPPKLAIFQSVPNVVASGMTPPNRITP